MIGRLSLICAVALTAGAAVVAQQPARDNAKITAAGGATISGKVLVNGDPKLPARRVRVTLNEISRIVPGQTTTTDDAGAFGFVGLPAGRFELKAFKAAYLTASYGASRPERPGTPIAVKDGDKIGGVTMSIVRGGVIAGTVRDQRGRPVPGISVRTLRFSYAAASGERTLGAPSGGAATATDDRGEYRAYGLPPGSYVVLANPVQSPGPGPQDIRPLTAAEVERALAAARTGNSAPGATAAAAIPASTARVNYAPVFFPGVTDITSATTVTLGLSEERTGIDVAIQYVATAKISGTVSFPGGTLPQTLQVSLVPGAQQELLAGAGVRGVSATPGPDGRFSFSGIAPGLYKVKATAGSGAGRGGAASGGPSLWAAAEVPVSGQDITVSLTLQPGVNINGRVVFEGAQPTAAELQAIAFRLLPPGAGGQTLTFGGGGQVGADGRFSFTGVTPDSYRYFASASGPAGKWTIKSSIANGRESWDAPLVVMANETLDWTVTYTDTPAGVSGNLQDATGRAATDYYILVFSAERRYWTPGSKRVRMTRPGTDGAFSAAGLAPGDYLIAAMTDLDAGEWNDPGLLEQLVASATKVTLRDGETTRQDLRIGGVIGQTANGRDQR